MGSPSATQRLDGFSVYQNRFSVFCQGLRDNLDRCCVLGVAGSQYALTYHKDDEEDSEAILQPQPFTVGFFRSCLGDVVHVGWNG